MRFHELKCVKESFEAIRSGEKTCEFRRDDREGGYQVGDVLVLRCGLSASNAQGFVYAGHVLPETVRIKHDVRGPDFGIPEGFAMLSIERVRFELVDPRVSEARL